MSEYDEQNLDNDSIFNTDLTDVDISRPCLKHGAVQFDVAECKVALSKDRSRKHLAITLKTRFEEVSTKAEVLHPGFTVNHNIGLTTSERYSEEAIQQNLKKFRWAVTGDKTGSFGDPAQYVDRQVTANVKTEVDKGGQYPDKTVVSSWVLPTAKTS